MADNKDKKPTKEMGQTKQEIDILAQELEGLSVTEKEEEAPESLVKVAKWIKDGHVQRILVLSGAGVSVSAGIPDFRTPGTGLYDNLQKYNLPFPEAVFDLHFYRRNPKPFLSLAKEIWPGLSHSPTLTHSFVALLSQKGLLLRNYSQNIDGLEVLASIPFQEIVECHGHFRSASCIECRRPASDDYERIILETNDFPTCKHCGGYVKPDIVFFGEGLPDRFSRWLDRDLDEADLLLIMGTSLMVAPVSMIPNMVNDTCKRVLLNRERVGDLCDEERDVIHEGDCDDSVRTIARLLNWEQELLELNASTRIKETKREVE